MQTIYQFFRLIRFSNLLVILLTMCFTYALLADYQIVHGYPVIYSNPDAITLMDRLGLTDRYFLMLLLSVILIAASGNIINDYFDRKADRVNKPNRLIMDRYVKRRWAIILNWTFNGIGFILAAYLSYRLHNWWIIFIAFASINLLYFYSAIFKRKFLSGNVIVAALTAVVPVYVFIYASFSHFPEPSVFEQNTLLFEHNWPIIVIYSGFAFLLNLIREIIKDMADVKGDLLLQSQTFPIRYGFAKTKIFLGFLYALTLIPLATFIVMGFWLQEQEFTYSTREIIFTALLIGVALFLVGSLLVLYSKNRRKTYLLASNLIKGAMLFGVISTLFFL